MARAIEDLRRIAFDFADSSDAAQASVRRSAVTKDYKKLGFMVSCRVIFYVLKTKTERFFNIPKTAYELFVFLVPNLKSNNKFNTVWEQTQK